MVDAAGQLQQPGKGSFPPRRSGAGFHRSRHTIGLPVWCDHPTTKRSEVITMMRAKTEQKVKRWKDQRWLIDSVIQAVGMEWDQPRVNYTIDSAGPDPISDFRTVMT